MGSWWFTEEGHEPDVKDAFRIASEEAGYKHGHGYSGSLSDKMGCVVVDRTVRTLSNAYTYVEQLSERTATSAKENAVWWDKWGPAAAIPFVNDGEIVKTRTVTKTVTIRSETLQECVDTSIAINKVVKEVANGVKLKPNEKVDAVRYNILDVKQQVRNIPTSGKKVTQYVIRNISGRSPSLVGSPFRTQTEAKKHLIMLLKNEQDTIRKRGWVGMPAPRLVGEYEIVAEVRRENGEPLVKMVNETTSVKIEISINLTTHTTTPEGTIHGWLFFGMAPS